MLRVEGGIVFSNFGLLYHFDIVNAYIFKLIIYDYFKYISATQPGFTNSFIYGVDSTL